MEFFYFLFLIKNNNNDDIEELFKFILTCTCHLFNKVSWNLITLWINNYNKNMDNEQNLLLFL
jgi:hypothetical protein